MAPARYGPSSRGFLTGGPGRPKGRAGVPVSGKSGLSRVGWLEVVVGGGGRSGGRVGAGAGRGGGGARLGDHPAEGGVVPDRVEVVIGVDPVSPFGGPLQGRREQLERLGAVAG